MEAGNRGYCQVNELGKITYANSEMAYLWGGKSPQGLSVCSLFKDQTNFLTAALEGKLGKRPGLRIMTMVRPDGTELPVYASVGHVRRGGVNRAYVVLSDLSKFISQDLMVLEKMPLGIAQIDLNHRKVYANSKMAEYFGATPAELVGCSMQELASGSQRTLLLRKIREREQGFSDDYPLTSNAEIMAARSGSASPQCLCRIVTASQSA